MHAPLLLALGTRNKLDQVVKTAHVNSPQHPVMDAGIIIHLLQPERGEEILKNWERTQSRNHKWTESNLLFKRVCRNVKHIPDQKQNPLYKKIIFFLPLFPVLNEQIRRNHIKQVFTPEEN